MDALMDARLDKIRKEFEEENSLSAKPMEFDKTPDFSGFKDMKEGEVACVLEKKADGTGENVVVTWPGSRIVIDPYDGAKIINWEIKGITVCTLAGYDAIWWPKEDCRMINGAYEFIGQEKTDGVISLIFTKKLSPGAYGRNIGGLQLIKTYSFMKDKFSVKTKIENLSDHSTEFSFRFHNFLSMTKDKKAVKWAVEMLSANGDKEIADTGKGDIQLFRLGKANVEMDSQHPKKITQIVSGEVCVKIQDSDFSLTAGVPRKELVYGWFFWGCSLNGIPSSSLEPIFEKTQLAQGQNWTAEMTWGIIRSR
jgi:hypothetical protein